jgi:hypothetical protein
MVALLIFDLKVLSLIGSFLTSPYPTGLGLSTNEAAFVIAVCSVFGTLLVYLFLLHGRGNLRAMCIRAAVRVRDDASYLRDRAVDWAQTQTHGANRGFGGGSSGGEYTPVPASAFSPNPKTTNQSSSSVSS